MKERKMSFGEHDGHGNGRGVVITLLSSATSKDILEIAEDYSRIGWKPSRKTKILIDAANKNLSKCRPSKNA